MGGKWCNNGFLGFRFGISQALVLESQQRVGKHSVKKVVRVAKAKELI